MIATFERPPFDDTVAIAAIGILVDAGRVADASGVLRRYDEWAAQLPESVALKLKDIELQRRLARNITTNPTIAVIAPR